MVELTLLKTGVKHMEFELGKLQEGKLELEHKYTFRVNYNREKTQGVAHLTHLLRSKFAAREEEALRLQIEVMGVFACAGVIGEEDQMQAHVEAYRELFPYSQMMVQQLMAMAGIPPLLLKPDKMDVSRVNLYQKGPLGEEN